MPRCSCPGSHVLGSFFLSALLPPRDDDDNNNDDDPGFYEIMGVEASATNEELRKAYKKLSLKFHPDKIAQRGGTSSKSKEEAAAKYEKIQEAYHVLIDEKQRLKYDALGTPKRYRFVERGGFADPQALYENLVGASFRDKSRLVGLFFLAILLVLTQPLLVAAKIEQTLREAGPLETSSWFAILIPYWVVGALFVVLTFAAAVFVVPAEDTIGLCLVGLEQILWFTGIVFLCLKWDETWDDSVLYRQTLGPIYAAMVVRWSRSFLKLQKVRNDVNRMVTSYYIENEFLKGRTMEDLPEEEQEDLMKAFLVVSVDPEFVPSAEDLTDEELEEERVASSPEFEAATELYSKSFYSLSCSLLFGSIFLILLTLKLDDRLGSGADWWAVFSPFWIEKGGRLAFCLFKCCFGGISGDDVVVYAGEDYPMYEADDDNEEEESKHDKVQNEAITDEYGTKVSPENEVSAEDGVKRDKQVGISKSGEEEAKHSVSTEDAKANAVSSASDSKNNGHDDDDDDDEEIHLDQDTYDAFQSAYQEAQKTTESERAQSCTDACVLIFQIIIVSLVVAKIDKNFDSDDPNHVGFNVFWILFPFFLVFGLTLCCCAILIFGAAPEPPEGETGEAGSDPENPNVTEIADVVTAPPAIPVEKEEKDKPAAVVETSVVAEKEVEQSIPDELSNELSDNNMDDLD